MIKIIKLFLCFCFQSKTKCKIVPSKTDKTATTNSKDEEDKER